MMLRSGNQLVMSSGLVLASVTRAFTVRTGSVKMAWPLTWTLPAVADMLNSFAPSRVASVALNSS